MPQQGSQGCNPEGAQVSRAVIQGVEVPFELDDFCTPRWPSVLGLYREWAGRVEATKQQPWAIQGYMLAFAKALRDHGYEERLGPKVYKSDDEIVSRALEHFGVVGFTQMLAANG